MFNQQMKDKLKEFNDYLGDRDKERPEKAHLREKLSTLGRFVKINKLTPSQIAELTVGQGIVGVDGSYTTFGNTYPHIIFLGQALAKCTSDKETQGVKQTYLETGITYLEKEDSEEAADIFLQNQRRKVTQMEVEVAHEALQTHNPFITMFDGGFWRLSKEAGEQWEAFREETLERNTLAVGVIEDSGSYDMWLPLGYKFFTPDSDILFGLLDIGEVFILNDLYREKFIHAFARFSSDPLPIACDFLPEQQEHILDILNLVYSLTPQNGRGIPLWIDIVDSEVKLTHESTEMLIDACLDPVYKQRFFTGKRNRR